jgi:hypothetical protein
MPVLKQKGTTTNAGTLFNTFQLDAITNRSVESGPLQTFTANPYSSLAEHLSNSYAYKLIRPPCPPFFCAPCSRPALFSATEAAWVCSTFCVLFVPAGISAVFALGSPPGAFRVAWTSVFSGSAACNWLVGLMDMDPSRQHRQVRCSRLLLSAETHQTLVEGKTGQPLMNKFQ